MRRTLRCIRSLTLYVGVLGAAFLVAGWPRTARAFCGFYVSGADAKLVAEATQVVLMREGTRTVLSMQNDYKGPPEGFAMVVPVPVVLQRDNVKTLPREVFDRVDKLSAPRLVEYWEQDPCPKPMPSPGDLSGIGSGGAGQGFGSGHGRLGGSHSVTIEAQFEVGEYEIVILSAQDSTGLDTWLKQNGYKIPDNAEPALRPYVQAGSKFFVAKVNVAKVKFEDGRASLSPLRFHYDSEKLELPVRLGMLNSSGTQDLIVSVLAPNQRYVVANYPNVTIPTNLDVAEAARKSFPAFYAALLDRALEKTPRAIVTEYAWPSSSCDPCPGNVTGLSSNDLVTLGADVLPSTKSGAIGSGGGSPGPSVRFGAAEVKGKLPLEVVQRVVRQSFGRFRICYEQGLRTNPSLQGRVTTKFEIDAAGSVAGAKDAGSDLPDPNVVKCVVTAFQNLSFPQPEEKANVIVTVPLNFSAGGGPPTGGLGVGAGRVGFTSVGSFVLTRLHARYTKDALGNDLVFKEAPPIVGGREMRAAGGALETGAVASTVNSFQARYAIRHEWPGAIACKEPRRGVWGGPWPDAGVVNSTPVAAQKLAYAPRGNLTLASFVPNGVPELAAGAPAGGSLDIREGDEPRALAADGGAGAGGDGAGGAKPAAPSPRCGCRVVGTSSSVPVGLGASSIVVAGLALRRRRRS